MAKFADRVKVSTPTTGQGTTISLGSAESGFQVVPTSLNGHTLRYVIEEGSAWEVGTAVYDSSGPSLTSRTLTSSSTGQLLSLSGSAKVFISASADDLDLLYADITVTVSGGNYLIDGTANQTITLVPSVTYRFDVSDSTNASHPLRFSTTSDGTHNSGSQFTTGITSIGTAGSAGAIIEVKLEQDAPALYYYCANHSGMGGAVSMGGTTYSNATTSADGLMSSADKTKLDGVATSANNYSLPTASASTLGGIKIGTGLSIDGSGVVTASGSSSSGGSLEPITTTKTTATAGQTVFTGTWKAENIAVFLNGVKLQDSEVTATDTQITISATAVGDIVEVVEYGAPFASPYASTFPTVTTGATSVTVDYTVDKVAVYKNGVKLRGGGVDFTASNGTSITGFSAFVANDVVEVVEHGSLAESGGGVTSYTGKSGTDGTPSGATYIDNISSPSEGDLAYDLAADQLYVRTTSTWKRVALGVDESPIVTTEPASTHILNTDGSTSTVTMVAEDPEGFDVTYGIAYPTASNALPNQLANSTAISSSGVFTFDPSTNISHAGSVKVRLSASDGARTTTRFCTLSLGFSAVVDWLIVAGGGGGGKRHAGGGGAGGLIYSTSQTLNAGIAYTITVGTGGTISTVRDDPGGSGGDSSISGSGLTTVTAIGGGGGAGSSAASPAQNGGSGGGGSYPASTAGTGTSGQGNNGANGMTSSPYHGGGGGGSGSAGYAPISSRGGTGGDATSNSITGTAVLYAAGGGGGSYNTSTTSSGGSGIGGNGGAGLGSATSPTANTGSGGGGAGGGSSDGTPTAGADGVVIIRSTKTATATTGSPTVTTDGSYNVYKFTVSGSITF